MFTDARSKRIVFVSHCILNQNSISDNTADFAGTFPHVAELLLKSNVGIVQMPCPELLCLGLDRGDIHGVERDVVVENTRIREAIARPPASERLEACVEEVLFQIDEYSRHDFSILGIIGINRSPSCGIDTTSRDNQERPGMGVFMESIADGLQRKNMHIDMVGVKTSEIANSMRKVESMLMAT